MSVVLVAGALLLATGVALCTTPLTRTAVLVQVAGALLIAGGASAVLLDGDAVGGAFSSAPHPALGVDGLSAFFMVVVALSAIPALIYSLDGVDDGAGGRGVRALTGIFVLVLLGVLAARDVTTFLAFWELMTLVPATAILLARRDRRVRNAVFVYLAITHLGGAGVWVALLLLADAGAIGGHLSDGPQALVIVAALIGFSTKAGLMPLHTWLPRAHPVAPSHVSALMSGVMIKVALYGLIRVLFHWAAPAPLWAGLTLLAFGVLSAVGGVLYALLQGDLKRLLAFSSIENIGIVAAGLGASLVLAHDHQPLWSSVAFAGALLHVANHAAMKGLLFLGAGAIAHAAGTLQLNDLGGLLRRTPWVAWPFLIGCVAISGVPPLNGFASEWLALQSVLHLGYSSAGGVSLAGAAATIGLGLASALAVLCFVKVIGLTLLGHPRTPQALGAVDAPIATRVALGLAAGACVVLSVLPGVLLPTLIGLAPNGSGRSVDVSIVLPGTGTLPGLWLLLVLVVVATGAGRVLGGGRARAPAAPTWASGQPVTPALRWTSAGFTKPLRLVLEQVLRPDREIVVLERPGIVRNVRHRLSVPHLFDTLLYGPLHRTALRGARIARTVQTGDLGTYVLYLLGLVLVLLALLRTGVLG
jgi:hydrogenase-4 component B